MLLKLIILLTAAILKISGNLFRVSDVETTYNCQCTAHTNEYIADLGGTVTLLFHMHNEMCVIY